MRKDTVNYWEIWGMSTVLILGLSSILVILTRMPHFFALILIPAIVIPLWAAIAKIYNVTKSHSHKKVVADNPLLALGETLQSDAWGFERQGVRTKIAELLKIVKHLSSFPSNEISDELLIFAEAANTMLTEYREKAKMLYRIDECRSDRIGNSLITKITEDLNVLVDKWAKNTADNLQASMESWETIFSSSGVLTKEEEELLNEMGQKNE